MRFALGLLGDWPNKMFSVPLLCNDLNMLNRALDLRHKKASVKHFGLQKLDAARPNQQLGFAEAPALEVESIRQQGKLIFLLRDFLERLGMRLPPPRNS